MSSSLISRLAASSKRITLSPADADELRALVLDALRYRKLRDSSLHQFAVLHTHAEHPAPLGKTLSRGWFEVETEALDAALDAALSLSEPLPAPVE